MNAKKEDNTNLIPYRATSVWRKDGKDYSSENQSLNFVPTRPEVKEEFARLTEKIAPQISQKDRDRVLGNSVNNDER